MNRIFLIVFFCTSIISFGQETKNHLLQFNGLYETECSIEKDDDEGIQRYLRFYSDGKVISVSTDCDGTASDIKVWFNLENKYVSVGNYKIKRHKIRFSTKSERGTVQYHGRIDKYGFINLRSKSLINGHKNKEKYKFIRLNDVK